MVHRLLQVSDTHLAVRPRDGDDAAPAARRNWAALRPWLAGAGADALVHTGDLVRLLPETAEDRALAAAELAAVGGTRLVVPGNHDVGHGLLDDPEASVEGPITAARVAAHRGAFGADRFAHELGAWLLLGINAHLLGTGMDEEGEQDEWLRATLRGAGGRPLALFLHLPLFLVDPDEPGDHATRTITVPAGPRRRLLDALGPGLRLVASGHLHQHRSAVVGGVAHVWAPSAAFTFPPIPDIAPLTDPQPPVTGVLEYRLTDRALTWGRPPVPGLEPYEYRPRSMRTSD